MNKKQFSNEPVIKALSETTRAISKKNDLTINFENEATKINQNTIQLSRISNDNSRNDIIFARGEADSKALYIRYHDESIDQKYAPKGDIALNLFNETRGVEEYPSQLDITLKAADKKIPTLGV